MRQRDRQGDRQIVRQRDRDRQGDRQIVRQRDRDRQGDRETDCETKRQTGR